jgi:hypothetical protein
MRQHLESRSVCERKAAEATSRSHHLSSRAGFRLRQARFLVKERKPRASKAIHLRPITKTAEWSMWRRFCHCSMRVSPIQEAFMRSMESV